MILALIITAVTLLFCCVICFTGDIRMVCQDTGITVEASWYSDLYIAYEDIESIEYRSMDDPGSRINGFGTPKLLMGWFRNTEFGNYMRYSYGKPDACIVIKTEGRTIVLGCRTEDQTRTIYETISEKCEKGAES